MRVWLARLGPGRFLRGRKNGLGPRLVAESCTHTKMALESDDSVSGIIRAAASSLGYAEIRLLLVQETAVRAYVTGSDVFLSVPTGSKWQVAVLCSVSSRVRHASGQRHTTLSVMRSRQSFIE